MCVSVSVCQSYFLEAIASLVVTFSLSHSVRFFQFYPSNHYKALLCHLSHISATSQPNLSHILATSQPYHSQPYRPVLKVKTF